MLILIFLNFLTISMNAGAQTVLRPFSDAEEVGFIAMTAEEQISPEDIKLDELENLRLQLIENLPDEVMLILYAQNQERVDLLKNEYRGLKNFQRVIFLVTPGAAALPTTPEGHHPKGVYEGWGRDSLPYPVVTLTQNRPQISYSLVDSVPGSGFEPDAGFAKALGLPLISTQTRFRGGNLMPDLEGNCFLENALEVPSLLKENPHFLQDFFGCKSVHILDAEGGIGDIDERLKFLPGNIAITDSAAIKQKLQTLGYDVRDIPQGDNTYETYMNSIIVNGSVFIPVFGSKTDEIAIKAYQNLGFKVFPVISKILSNDFHGSLHCLTMNFPVGTFTHTSSFFPEPQAQRPPQTNFFHRH